MTESPVPVTAPLRSINTHVVGVGDEAVTYDIHGDLADATGERPVLFLFASPMAAAAFGPMAGRITDRPVVTYDPRGAGRNPSGRSALTPEDHAEDLHRVISALGGGPVDVFASSGGAVNAMALATAHPDDIRRAVLHEPPMVTDLPDRSTVLAAIRDITDTYRASGEGPAMARFIKLVMTDGPLPDDYLDQPVPDPAMFGLPTADDGSRTSPLMRNIPACNEYRIDAASLGRFGDRLVVAVGTDANDEIAARGARAVAAALGLAVTPVPSHHAGFTTAEHTGRPGDPEGFAVRLRELLS